MALGLGLWADRRGLEPIAQVLQFASNSQRSAAISKESATLVTVLARDAHFAAIYSAACARAPGGGRQR